MVASEGYKHKLTHYRGSFEFQFLPGVGRVVYGREAAAAQAQVRLEPAHHHREDRRQRQLRVRPQAELHADPEAGLRTGKYSLLNKAYSY